MRDTPQSYTPKGPRHKTDAVATGTERPTAQNRCRGYTLPAAKKVMKELTISIAMATYNGERFLREQLDSFVEQSRQPD